MLQVHEIAAAYRPGSVSSTGIRVPWPERPTGNLIRYPLWGRYDVTRDGPDKTPEEWMQAELSCAGSKFYFHALTASQGIKLRICTVLQASPRSHTHTHTHKINPLPRSAVKNNKHGDNQNQIQGNKAIQYTFQLCCLGKPTPSLLARDIANYREIETDGRFP